MPSCIPDFEYDIFVSYRQKDNRHDGWVTQFVDNLKKELEVTFKEEISVYFDENLDDGILEAHEVDDTVRSKLKCLIFIPIISQTYCDPSSFAWNKEFLAFRDVAGADKFGMKIRLPNGNVTSRILPVRIHELDAHDALLLEKELGGPIRSIDFVYAAPGVNRPLRVQEDSPQQNLNRTNYRDQINKLANLTKQIITSLKAHTSERWEVRESEQPVDNPMKVGRKRKLAFVLLLSLAAVVSAYFLAGRIPLSTHAAHEPTTIAVLPFKVIGDDETSVYLADGIQEAVRANLCMFPELRVKSRTSVERYRSESKSVPEISAELKVAYVLEGTAQRMGDQIRITVQLIEAESDETVWSEQFNRKVEDLFSIQSQISETIAKSLKATLTPDIAGRLNKLPTEQYEVYELFLRSQQVSKKFSNSLDPGDLEKAIGLLEEALQKDPGFALGYGWLAGFRLIRAGDEVFDPQTSNEIVSLANTALQLDATVVEANLALSELYFITREDVKALRYTYKALEHESLDAASILVLMKRLGLVYSRVGVLDKAQFVFDELLKVDQRDEEVLYEKIIVLAANRKKRELIALKNELGKREGLIVLASVIDLHLAIEEKSPDRIIGIYDGLLKNGGVNSPYVEPYLVIFAECLRAGGRTEDAENLLGKYGELLSEPFLNVQLLLYRGKNKEALQLLSTQELGWYNLTLSQVSPVFSNSIIYFGEYFTKNQKRLEVIQTLIQDLERKGELPGVESIDASLANRLLSILGFGQGDF